MRLRQIALVAEDLAPHAAALERIFDIHVGYRDPGVGVFGLVNIVCPIGGDFLEIVQPVRDDASAGRYLKRRGGDCGYMAIFQADDALAHRDRLARDKVRLIAEMDERGYVFTHFHPGDFGGVLASIDQVRGGDWRETMSDWPPCGRDWRNFPSKQAIGIPGVAIQARDPDAATKLWASRLDAPANGRTVKLERGEIRFVPPVDEDGTGIVELDIAVKDAAAVRAAAEKENALDAQGRVKLCGVAINLV